jgi:tRNA 2-thiocytidine biosynthesis protein TtcA
MKNRYKFPAKINRKIGQAMCDYSMFEDGDKVLVAVSGGVDSLTLACVLKKWQKKAPIQFEFTAYNVDHGFWQIKGDTDNPGNAIGRQLASFSIGYKQISERVLGETERTCFLCSRNRRNQLFDLAREQGYNKIALGHHKDDLLETFMLNILYSGNISTMRPLQKLFGGSLCIVRPLAYLDKAEIWELSRGLNLEPVKNLCPLSVDTRREKVRDLLTTLYIDEPGVKASLFAALSNVRADYLL